MFVGNHIADINIIVETHTEGLSTVIRINDMIYWDWNRHVNKFSEEKHTVLSFCILYYAPQELFLVI